MINDVENISKTLENMNIKCIHNITVEFINESTKTFHSVSPLCSVKFVNRNLARLEQFGEFRPYIIYKIDNYTSQNGLLVVSTFNIS